MSIQLTLAAGIGILVLFATLAVAVPSLLTGTRNTVALLRERTELVIDNAQSGLLVHLDGGPAPGTGFRRRRSGRPPGRRIAGSRRRSDDPGDVGRAAGAGLRLHAPGAHRSGRLANRGRLWRRTRGVGHRRRESGDGSDEKRRGRDLGRNDLSRVIRSCRSEPASASPRVGWNFPGRPRRDSRYTQLVPLSHGPQGRRPGTDCLHSPWRQRSAGSPKTGGAISGPVGRRSAADDPTAGR